MTVVAVGLGIVQRMTEAHPEGRHERRRSSISAQLMTSAARRNVAPVRLRPRRVTTKAGRMRVEISGYGHRDTATRGTMTGDAADAAHREMLRMIELHAKAHQARGKWFQRA